MLKTAHTRTLRETRPEVDININYATQYRITNDINRLPQLTEPEALRLTVAECYTVLHYAISHRGIVLAPDVAARIWYDGPHGIQVRAVLPWRKVRSYWVSRRRTLHT